MVSNLALLLVVFGVNGAASMAVKGLKGTYNWVFFFLTLFSSTCTKWVGGGGGGEMIIKNHPNVGERGGE